MPKNTVGSQKIYTTLSDYTAAQEIFTRVVGYAKDTEEAKRKVDPSLNNHAMHQARGMARIIRALKLPIDTSMIKP